MSTNTKTRSIEEILGRPRLQEVIKNDQEAKLPGAPQEQIVRDNILTRVKRTLESLLNGNTN